ncbi:PREDICTED: acyl-CoA-binding domain-containing protein 5A-like isoform X1 [Poecilia mexicana]|uniref:acyl-CoA-binding domain-containing protein 5A-like isoform X1 n=1 Tax=Poecilia mexicana TaxID=48701 RepID=UPI00072E231F|nr:PREDICTED: acyl-CoA-binding domain-containing protein 5A-like isoform X1 [Poecilia mexicana]XP_014859945.1 PREDICTED: acyl-CoA-binding domain-containing protein 5A-like isoform X1 [Poecilia mexicana]XP_014859946.1 PREDICTED: acyl-CoA-binding domain-containing protein 5A-like isoform X1 [Poecilia mexicana]XP_014859947.1 PREDICTED: acyl-CoA-binding domain-containing protein 5A-like isoform X1 [Poecilia mexicana]XP_014859948.1 PREDICTED: acyl-CoA-binding domain-containing protein 5A-like isofor
MSSPRGLGMAQQEKKKEEEDEEDEYSLEAKFTAAVKVIRSLPDEGPFQPSDDMMLMFYSYYKQATLGPCHFPRPTGFWDTGGKAKWDAWSSLGNMTKEEAMKNYIEHIQLILETIPISEEVTELVQTLGNFYTEVDGEEEGNQSVRRPFTRPFADHSEELIKSIKKPTMEGYGDLWEDIQNVQERDRDLSALRRSVSSEEAEGGKVITQESRENWNEDFCADNVETRDWDQDPRFLTVEDRRWRSDTKGSNSSLEPSVSSFTNGTHSSLNSEVEEEELACSMEPTGLHNPYLHFNGYFNDDHNANPERNCRPTDSDNEEFCDSMEHLAMEERLPPSKGRSPGLGATSAKTSDVWFESSTTLKDAEDEGPAGDFHMKERAALRKHSSSLSKRGRGSPRATCFPLRCASADAACGCVLRSRHPAVATRGNTNEQIAAALQRLQHNMADVLHRLHALEELTRSQSRPPSPRQEGFLPVPRKLLRPSWWPFHLSPLTVVLTALWPLVTHWLVQLYFQRKRSLHSSVHRKIP